jgi:TetR/AcrR family transcriptional regulator, transcriptional repressor for nem operon
LVRYREGHRERTRQEIIASASELMRERGFDEATVGAVMKAVGLTHGGFYAHFPDKVAMLTAAMEAAFTASPKNFAVLAQMARDQGDVGLIANHYLGDQRVADVASGCPAAALVSETPRQDLTVRAAFQSGAQATAAALATAPGLSEDEGGTPWAALSMLVGGLTMMRAVTDPALSALIRNQIINAMRKLAIPDDKSRATRKDTI